MRARRARPSRLIAAGTFAALSVGVLAGCASEAAPGASTSTTAPAPSATPLPTHEPAEPTTSATSAGTTTITSPVSGAMVDGPDIAVTGTGTGFEANLAWEVVPATGGEPIARGFTTAGASGEIGPFAITATLPSGQVTLSVWEPDMSDGAAGTARHNLASVTFTVR